MPVHADITPLPIAAVITKRDLENFFYQRGADVLAINESPGHVEVHWWPVPSLEDVQQALLHQTPAGIELRFSIRSRWWAAWRLFTYAVRVFFRGSLR